MKSNPFRFGDRVQENAPIPATGIVTAALGVSRVIVLDDRTRIESPYNVDRVRLFNSGVTL